MVSFVIEWIPPGVISSSTRVVYLTTTLRFICLKNTFLVNSLRSMDTLPEVFGLIYLALKLFGLQFRLRNGNG